MGVIRNIRWWLYHTVPYRFAWAVEYDLGRYQTFFAFDQAHAERIAVKKFGSNSYLVNREWM